MDNIKILILHGLVTSAKHWLWRCWSTFSLHMLQNFHCHSWNCLRGASIVDARRKFGKPKTNHRTLMWTQNCCCSRIWIWCTQASRYKVTTFTRKTSRTCALCSCIRRACRSSIRLRQFSSLFFTGFTRVYSWSTTARRRSSTRTFRSSRCGGSNSASSFTSSSAASCYRTRISSLSLKTLMSKFTSWTTILLRTTSYWSISIGCKVVRRVSSTSHSWLSWSWSGLVSISSDSSSISVAVRSNLSQSWSSAYSAAKPRKTRA